jgi:hypothetical protein
VFDDAARRLAKVTQTEDMRRHIASAVAQKNRVSLAGTRS